MTESYLYIYITVPNILDNKISIFLSRPIKTECYEIANILLKVTWNCGSNILKVNHGNWICFQ